MADLSLGQPSGGQEPEDAVPGAPSPYRRWAITMALVAVAIGVVAALVDRSKASFDHAMTPCLAAEASASPEMRVATCLCVVAELQSFTWAVFALATPTNLVEASLRATQNQCRALSYRVNRASG